MQRNIKGDYVDKVLSLALGQGQLLLGVRYRRLMACQRVLRLRSQALSRLTAMFRY